MHWHLWRSGKGLRSHFRQARDVRRDGRDGGNDLCALAGKLRGVVGAAVGAAAAVEAGALVEEVEHLPPVHKTSEFALQTEQPGIK